jgi:3-oxoacyl-[acyl-carrier-protein] synthase III
MKRYASITSTGTYIPKKKVTNNDFHNGLSGEEIERRTGIKSRYYISGEETLTSMAVEAALRAIGDSDIKDIGMDRMFFLFETPLTERWYNIAGKIQHELKGKGVNLDKNNFLNIPGGCSEYVDAMKLSTGLIESGRENSALVVTSSDNSRFLNGKDKGTAILFGDGASATLVQATSHPGFLGFYGKGKGEGYEKIIIGPDGTADWKIKMDGKAVFRFAVDAIEESVKGIVNVVKGKAKSKLGVNDVDKFIFHQANKRIINHTIMKLGIKEDRVYNTIEHYGNTGISSIGITLDNAIRNDYLQDGDKVVLVGFGVGLKFDISMFVYQKKPKVIS